VKSGSTPDAGVAPPPSGPEPTLPEAPADCPDLKTGTVKIQGQDVQLWVGDKQTDKKGPVLFYWHGTGSQAGEIQAFMGPMLTEIQAEGGIAASFTTTVGTGTNTGNFVWYTGDFDSADIILSCAIKQLNIDTHRIYAAGCSAGGLEAGAMAVSRSGYLAAAMPNSGGSLLSDWQDPNHTPAIITTHGTYAADFVILHFADVSKSTDQAFADRGGYAVDCDHGGGHCGAPAEVVAAQWQFLKDHPFGVATDPYADGLPSSFPSYCTKFTAQPATP
jgi:poly(3-hydroxybutyrate) depolymerase